MEAFEVSKDVGNVKNNSAELLKTLRITRDQSSQWQKLAAIPEEKFEAAFSWGYSLSLNPGASDTPSNTSPAAPPALPCAINASW